MNRVKEKGERSMTTPRRLSARQAKFAAAFASGIPASTAAKQAGYSPSKAHRGAELLRVPAVAAFIATAQEEARAKAVYDLTKAMQESLDVIDFAKQNKNAMAYFKAVEHRAKLSGLLVERVDVRAVVDVRAALEDARSRVQNWKGPTLLPNPLE
jgi:hypothetical protein